MEMTNDEIIATNDEIIATNVCNECKNDKLEKMFAINEQLYQLMEQGRDPCYNSYLDRTELIQKLTLESVKLLSEIKG